MGKKYKLLDLCYKDEESLIVRRIQYLKDIQYTATRKIHAGDLGGWLETEENLSQEGTCVVLDEAIVSGKAIVRDNAIVEDHAKIIGPVNKNTSKGIIIEHEAHVGDNAKVLSFACVREFGSVEGHAEVKDAAIVSGSACIKGYAVLADCAKLTDNATIKDHATAQDSTVISGNATLCDYASVIGKAKVHGYACCCDTAHVSGSAEVFGSAILENDTYVEANASISGSTKLSNHHIEKFGFIEHIDDTLYIGPIGSRSDYTTFYKTVGGGVCVSCGCFNGSLDEFIEEVHHTHANTKYEKEYMTVVQVARVKLLNE